MMENLNIRLSRSRRTRKVPSPILSRGPHDVTGLARVLGLTAYYAGAALLLWSSYLHYHLWHDLGYHAIPHIGDLFVAQIVADVFIAVVVATLRQVWTALLGAGATILTIVGFLLAVTHGILGFRESWTAPDAQLDFFVEVTTLVALTLATVVSVRPTNTGPRSSTHTRPLPR